MAITVDWPTKVVTVPQADLTFISGELYELDLDVFRLALKSIEGGEVGISFIDIHSHTAPFTFGSTTLSRVVEIINGYTITFEDVGAPYAVSLVGANSNIDASTNINNVSVRSNNTAGLVSAGTALSPSEQAALAQILSESNDVHDAHFGRRTRDLLTQMQRLFRVSAPSGTAFAQFLTTVSNGEVIEILPVPVT